MLVLGTGRIAGISGIVGGLLCCAVLYLLVGTVLGRGRLPVCRELLVEARKRSGGPRAGFGLFLGRP